MKQVLIETQLFQVSPRQLTEGTKSTAGNPIVEGILATAEVKNGNGRYYKKELWEREIDKYMSCVRENRALGELDHPESSIINLKNVSPSGNILKALIENNITVGVSSRGMGSLKPLGETMEVQDDFELLCWDFVSTPSNPGSWMHPVKGMMNEGLTTTLNPYAKVNSVITEILCANGSCPIF